MKNNLFIKLNYNINSKTDGVFSSVEIKMERSNQEKTGGLCGLTYKSSNRCSNVVANGRCESRPKMLFGYWKYEFIYCLHFEECFLPKLMFMKPFK